MSGAIGAVQAGQAPSRGIVQELAALAHSGMNLVCFDLAAGSLEQHLELAEHVAEVSTICCVIPGQPLLASTQIQS